MANESRVLGYVLNGAHSLVTFTSFGGEPVNPGDLLVRFTRQGDFNLDGSTNDNDVTLQAGFYDPNYNPAGPQGPRHWFHGDHNFDGIVGDADVTALAGFYNPAATPLGAEISGGNIAVPEPTALPTIAALSLIAGRRQRASRAQCELTREGMKNGFKQRIERALR